MTLTAAQVRQACTLLGWRSSMLASRAKIPYTAAMKLKTDAGIAALPPTDVWAIRTALEKAGVTFTWDTEGQPGAVLVRP